MPARGLLLSYPLEIAPVTAEAAERAAALRHAGTSLSLPDGLWLARRAQRLAGSHHVCHMAVNPAAELSVSEPAIDATMAGMAGMP